MGYGTVEYNTTQKLAQTGGVTDAKEVEERSRQQKERI
jgi:hypothetical protein